MKIVISHVYSKHNNGDAAILSAQIAMLRRAFQHPQIHILSLEPIEDGYQFDGIQVVNAVMFGSVSPANGRIKKVILAVAMIIYTTVWAATFRVSHVALPLPRAWREPMRVLAGADVQVCVGGGYLRAKKGAVSTILLLLLFHQVWLAKVLGKPVYLYSQSFGPYPQKIQMRIAATSLRRADLILVREAKSLALLGDMGVDGDRVVPVADSAFAFQPDLTPGRLTEVIGTDRAGEQVVGLTARAWLPPEAQREYERSIAQFIDRLSQRDGFRVVVIAQVTATEQGDDDRLVGQRIQDMLGSRDNVVFLERQFSHYEIKSVYAALDYLIGTRFHSVIFALTSGVPTLAIEYEHKTSGIMQDLGLGQWVLPMEDVTADRLAELFDDLVRDHDAYLRILREVMPGYVARAGETAALLRRAYDASPRSRRGARVAPL